MFGWFRKRKSTPATDEERVRAVSGAGVYRDHEGRVAYNMLDPMMQQFLGRCVGAIKKAGIHAKGSGQFSVLLGDEQQYELILDPFWARFAESQDVSVFDDIVAAARESAGG